MFAKIFLLGKVHELAASWPAFFIKLLTNSFFALTGRGGLKASGSQGAQVPVNHEFDAKLIYRT